MLSIGEFSRICEVTPKTLRYYEEIGLLYPEEISLENGYRYYSIKQLEKMLLINRLKSYKLSLEEIKTKKIAEMLKNLKVDTKALIVLPEKDEKVYRSAKNIPGVATSFVGTLNVYELLKHDKLIITKDAAEKLVEVYA